jgi:uncharacterized membrane protein
MNPHIVSRFAIYLLALVMIIFGIYHFTNPQSMLIYVPDYIPGGIIWVYFVGISFILAALAFISNKMVSLAGYLLALLLVIFVLTIHLPNYLHAGDKDMRQLALVSLLKDTALAGFALYIASTSRHQHLVDTLQED